ERELTRLHRGAAFLGPAQVAQRGETTLAEHPARGLGYDAEDPAYLARLDPHRVVRDVEVGLLGEAMPVHVERMVRRVEGLTGHHDLLEKRPQHVPDLAPHLPAGSAQHAGMLVTQHRNVGVVVELDPLRSPEHADLGLGGQQDADGAAKALWPRVDGPERRGRPVQAWDAIAHFAAAREPRGGRARLGAGLIVAHVRTPSSI